MKKQLLLVPLLIFGSALTSCSSYMLVDDGRKHKLKDGVVIALDNYSSVLYYNFSRETREKIRIDGKMKWFKSSFKETVYYRKIEDSDKHIVGVKRKRKTNTYNRIYKTEISSNEESYYEYVISVKKVTANVNETPFEVGPSYYVTGDEAPEETSGYAPLINPVVVKRTTTLQESGYCYKIDIEEYAYPLIGEIYVNWYYSSMRYIDTVYYPDGYGGYSTIFINEIEGNSKVNWNKKELVLKDKMKVPQTRAYSYLGR